MLASHVFRKGTGKAGTGRRVPSFHTTTAGVTIYRRARKAAGNAIMTTIRILSNVSTLANAMFKPDGGGALSGVRTGMPYDFNKVLEPVR